MRPFVNPQPVDFDQTINARIVCSLGSVDVASGLTMVTLWRPIAPPAGYQTLLTVETAVGNALVSLLLTPANRPYLDIAAVGTGVATAVVATNVWQLIAFTKASGSSAPRSHIYSFATGVWTRENLAAIGDTVVAQGQVSIGAFDIGTAHFADGYGAAWAIYGDPLSDAQLDQFPVHYSKWVDGLSPQAFWVARGTTALDDLVGSADETSRGSGVTAAAATIVSPVAWAHEFRPANTRYPRAVPPRLRSEVAA